MPELPAQTRVYQLLELAPGPDISVAAAACLLAMTPGRTARALHELRESRLLSEPAPGRYRMRDVPGGQPATRIPSREGNDAPRRRLVDFYVQTACAADRLLWPDHPAVRLAPPVEGCVPERFASRDAALAWLDAEHDCLIAIRAVALKAGLHAAVWQLAASLKAHFVLRGETQQQLAQWQDALAAADALGDAGAQILAHRFYGQACTRAGLPDQAAEHLRQAVRIAGDHDDHAALAQAHYMFAWVSEQAGDYREALAHAVRARELFSQTHEAHGEAEALNAVGWYHAQLGDHDQATACCSAALALSRRHGYQDVQAAALDGLAELAERAGRHAAAAGHFRGALALSRDSGNSYQEAGILDRLGDTYAAAGHDQLASQAWRAALQLYRDQRRGDEAASVERRIVAAP